MSRIKAGKPPIIYKDEMQSRHFVNLRAIVEVNVLTMNNQAKVAISGIIS